MIFRYIYGGTINLTKQVIRTNVKLLIAADELCLNDLCLYIEDELLKDKELLKHNFVLLNHVANQFNHFAKLSNFYRDSFQQDPSLIFNANDFTTIKQEVLLDILDIMKNNHVLKQIEVWDKLIEWTIAQTDELPSDITKWTAENVTTFGILIQPFIPRIEFKEITPSDFFKKIKPFKEIFDNDFYVKLLEYYSFNEDLHSRFKMDIDSRIINGEQAFLLANFIKIMKKDALNIFYKFELLIRGSRDGFELKTFREICDYEGPTITVACIKDTNEILGVFNPDNWTSHIRINGRLSDCWSSNIDDIIDVESFIFSLDKNNLGNSIFSKAKQSVEASSWIKADLHLLVDSTNKGRYYKSRYEKSIRKNEGDFEISDYEVFQVRDNNSTRITHNTTAKNIPIVPVLYQATASNINSNSYSYSASYVRLINNVINTRGTSSRRSRGRNTQINDRVSRNFNNL